jgi:hypothetical protein
MRILAIMGSPRKKGNGFKVINRIEARMKTLGPVAFEYLYLKDVNLEMCRDCFLCVRQGKEKCPINDEQSELEAKILGKRGQTPSHITYYSRYIISREAGSDTIAYSSRLATCDLFKVGAVAPSEILSIF